MWTKKELDFIESYKEDIEAKLLNALFVALNQHFDGSIKGDLKSKQKLKTLFTYAFEGKEGFYIEIDRRGKSRSAVRASSGQERFRLYIKAKSVDPDEKMAIGWFRGTLNPSSLKRAMENPLEKWFTELTGNHELSYSLTKYLVDSTNWDN